MRGLHESSTRTLETPSCWGQETYAKIVIAVRAVEDIPYDGEAVDQLQHALQCAALAREAGYGSEVVVAALLHDIRRSPMVLREIEASGEHGEIGGRWLAPLVGERVAWLAEQHVPAKRYLVATDPDYRRALSETSRRTLKKQGGPFERHPGWHDAVALRRWDDLGKDPYAEVPPLEEYAEDLKTVIAANEKGAGPV